MKRVFDVVVAALLLVTLAPLLALLAGLVRLSGPGPVLYRGTRVGRDGRPFAMLKFRTMVDGAARGAAITIHGDTRVTRLGRVLRVTKLDELPQLINVLRGEMSLVGPRPEAPEYVAHYTPEQLGVLAVRPGITGLAQVRFRHEERLLYGPDWEAVYLRSVLPAKLALDREYLRSRSFWRDLWIIALTLQALVVREPPPRMPAGAVLRHAATGPVEQTSQSGA
jgi:lipopolysaccharide/colanic/teichoic acid biosynthesis glycosyltransferase